MPVVQNVAFNVTHFASRIAHFFVHSNKYNWTRLSKCLGFTTHTSSVANSKLVTLNDARCHSPYGTTHTQHSTCCIPRATAHLVWWRSVALQFTGPYWSRHFFYGGIWKLKLLLTPALTLTALKMQFARRLRMLRRTQQCHDRHGGHLQDVMKTWGFFFFFFFLWIQDTDLTVFSCIYCCVQ
jgi:hypothetical protein